jgi:hypothetical protein
MGITKTVRRDNPMTGRALKLGIEATAKMTHP